MSCPGALPDSDAGAKPTMTHSTTVALVMAMAPIDKVISSFLHNSNPNNLGVDSDTIVIQDEFSKIIDSQWNGTPTGPSKRYLRALVKQFVKRIEERDGAIESDLLSEFLFQSSLKSDTLPNADESCYLSFYLTRNKNENVISEQPVSSSLMRVRIYPQHNDVALRLWEAGAFLAEFIMEYPSEVSGQRVIELGAGIGCTAIVAAYLKASSVLATDYTAACLDNLQHNIEMNQDFLQSSGSMCSLSQGYLEWSIFSEEMETTSSRENQSRDKMYDTVLSEFYSADVLLAADVCYDIAVIDSLVLVMQSFLQQSTSKYALFAITKRNMTTFETFLGLLKKRHIKYEWVMRGSDCETIPQIFPCNFVQTREEICIARLSYG